MVYKQLPRKIAVMVLTFLTCQNPINLKAADISVYCEQISAGLRAPLAMAQNYIEDFEPQDTKKQHLVNFLTSAARITNYICQFHNNNIGFHSFINMPWTFFYDALLYFEAGLGLLGSENAFFDEVLSDEEKNENLNHQELNLETTFRQGLALIEGGTAFLASLYTGQRYTKNVRYLCYSLCSLSRLGSELLKRNTSHPKQILALLIIINSALIIYNLMHDYDAADRRAESFNALRDAHMNHLLAPFLAVIEEENQRQQRQRGQQQRNATARAPEVPHNAVPAALEGHVLFQDGRIRVNFPDGRPAIEGAGACTICLTDFARGIEVTRTGCNHFFCRECLQHWRAGIPNYMDGSPRAHPCPMCRADINIGGTQNAML